MKSGVAGGALGNPGKTLFRFWEELPAAGRTRRQEELNAPLFSRRLSAPFCGRSVRRCRHAFCAERGWHSRGLRPCNGLCRGARAKAALLAAADSAALAAARLPGTAAEREEIARRVFEGNLREANYALTNVTFRPENVTREGRNYGYRVRASGELPTTLSKSLGFQEVGVSTMAEAIGVLTTPTEVVMALDTTYSMTGWKIGTLKDAATRLVDELRPLAHEPDKLRFGIVPFAQYVNVGMSNRNRPWINVPANWTETVNYCNDEKSVIGQTNCRTEYVPPSPPSPPGTCYNDGVPYSCGGGPGSPGGNRTVCDNIYGPVKKVCGSYQVQHKWNGCVGSRNYPLDTRDDGYGTRIPGIMDVECGTEILDLTTNTNKVKSHILSLIPQGETYIPAGLIWGWRMLSPQAPLDAAAKRGTGQNVRKFLILMTDGLNTKSPSYPTHDGSDGAQSNQLLRETCKNVAGDTDNAITVFTVAFDVSDAATKSLLRTCALDTGGQFFDARSSADFLAAFAKIGMMIGEIRLTK